MAIQIKRGTSAQRKVSEVVLEAGQPFLETDTGNLFIGRTGTEKLKDLTLDNCCPSARQIGKQWDEIFHQNLEDFSWAEIHSISQRGLGGLFFHVGDTKTISINDFTDDATGDTCSCAGSYKVEIIGINHMGIPGITFQVGLLEGRRICLDEFQMNKTYSNSGGWKNSRMRATCNNFKSQALPSDLQSVLIYNTIYTGLPGVTEVEATKDYVFLLSEYEVFGTTNKSNANEQFKQAQFEFYKSGWNRYRYKRTNTQKVLTWWLRSPSTSTEGGHFAYVNLSSAYDYAVSDGAMNFSGFAPAFVV